MAILAVPLVLGLESSTAAIWALYAWPCCSEPPRPSTTPRPVDPAPGRAARSAPARQRSPHRRELTANEFIGPPGGLLVAAGVAAAFATPAALWAAAVGPCCCCAAASPFHEQSRHDLRADVAEGLRYLWRHRLLRTLAAMTGLFNLLTNATFAVFVLYAVSARLGHGPDRGRLRPAVRHPGRRKPHRRPPGRPHHPTPRPLRSLLVGLLGGVGTVGILALTTVPLVIAGVPHRRPHQRAVERRRRLAAPAHHPRPHPGPDQQQLPACRLGHRPAGCRRRWPPRRAAWPARRLRHRRRAHPRHLLGMPQVTDTAISTAEQDADN